MSQYSITVDKGNETTLRHIVDATNKNLGTKFTKIEYLQWLMNKWFENKRGEVSRNEHLRLPYVEDKTESVNRSGPDGSSYSPSADSKGLSRYDY